MSRKHKFLNPEGIYFVTATTVNWVDVFTRPLYKDILIDSFRFAAREKGMRIHAYVIMTNHFHMVVSAEDSLTLAATFRDVKKFTAHSIFKLIRDNPQESRKNWLLSMFGFEGRKTPDSRENRLWQEGMHPKELVTADQLENAINYVHMNPVRAGITFEPWEYRYSSAIDYMTDQKGLIDLVMLG